MQKTIRQLPLKFLMVFITILTLSIIGFYDVQLDDSQHLAKIIANQSPLNGWMISAKLMDYVHTIITRWVTLFIASITILLSLIHYGLSKDKRAVAIGMIQIPLAIYFMYYPLDFYNGSFNFIYAVNLVFFVLPFLCFIGNASVAYNLMTQSNNIKQMDHAQLHYIAEHDSLTDLYNRHQFEYLLNQSVAKCAVHFDYFALFIIDIDNFKQINDSYGHLHGDNLLKEFASQLTKIMRQGDILARIGGDEFALITAKLQSPAIVHRLADRIFNALNGSFAFSMGVAVYPLHGKNTENLIKNADKAMYHAKKMGKNQYHVCPDASFVHHLLDVTPAG